jgi:hypothetical protein
MKTPLSKGGAAGRVVAGGVSLHARQHTPPPRSRGESHAPGALKALVPRILLAEHVHVLVIYRLKCRRPTHFSQTSFYRKSNFVRSSRVFYHPFLVIYLKRAARSRG